MSQADLVGVALAAGAGTRLAPLTRLRPKPLCPVATVPLIDHALARLGGRVAEVAVNLHHGADQLDAHLPAAVHRSWERPEALGTAGALGHLREWIDGRAVLVTNADAWLGEGIGEAMDRLVAGWDGRRPRLLCVHDPQRGDFGARRYCGVALVPAAEVAGLAAEPSGLYERSWRAARSTDRLELVEAPVRFVDCGTPHDYLRANLEATGGVSAIDHRAVIAPGAIVARSVVWDGAEVGDTEVLDHAIRTARGTVLVR